MQGLVSLWPHLLTIVLIWIAVLVGLYAMRNVILSRDIRKNLNLDREWIMVFYRISRLAATGAAAVIFVVVVLFMYNPTERTYSEMDKMTEAKADQAYVEPTKEEIKQQNKGVVIEKSKEMRKDATEDNLEAMDAFKKLTEQTTK